MLQSFMTVARSVLVLGAGLVLVACGGDATGPAPQFSQTDLVVGTGAEATPGRRLTVHYTLWRYDPAGAEFKGRQIQSSVGGQPFSFTLGGGHVIRGWDQGVPGMRVGGSRRLVLPPDLAYGVSGAGRDIPPNATLVFDIELLSVQ